MNVYIVRVKKRYLYRIINLGIKFIYCKYLDDYAYLYLDFFNFKSLSKYNDIYDILFVDSYGINKILFLIKNNFIFLLCNVFGIFIILFLNNIIFNTYIICNNTSIKNLVSTEIKYYNIDKYKRVVNYDRINDIKNNIIKDNSNVIEWIEINRKGNNYYVNVLDRKINNNVSSDKSRHLVSKKNAVIYSISAYNGNVVKKINDYVSKGDIIVSGCISKGDECLKNIRSNGSVIGETWYNIKVMIPKDYIIKKYTGNSIKRFNIKFNDNYYTLFNKDFINYEYNDRVIFKNNLINLSFNYSLIKEYDLVYFDSINDITNLAFDISERKLMDMISKNSKILSKKKLKLYQENSKIYIEVFYKVLEDITDYLEY